MVEGSGSVGFLSPLLNRLNIEFTSITVINTLPYKVEWAFQCFNGEQLEREVHEELATYRVNQQREFFDIPLVEAQEAIEKIGKNYV